jgi:thiosulfate/3-mercaptopyruvate sulfurtransferase
MSSNRTPDLPGPLVDSSWLRAHLYDEDVRVVDCRFVLGDPEAGRRAYLDGHVPGAAFMDVDTELSAPPGTAGRHPLPDPEVFAAAARRAGIGTATRVVAYDDGMVGGAARLWWLLRHIGHDRASVLEGGLAAWGEPLAPGPETHPPGDLVARPRTDDTVDADDVLAALDRPGRLLLDARAPERFRGEREPVDRVAGHIPGARNLPSGETIPAPAELVADDRELVAYCGSGVTACVVALAFEAAGRGDVKLYPGSWSEWSQRGLPVATGG